MAHRLLGGSGHEWDPISLVVGTWSSQQPPGGSAEPRFCCCPRRKG